MRTSNGGFTLVEILIVVVILGILAAIVIPQFTQASTEARESSLVSNLQTIRSQIELYKIQHNDNPPAVATFEAQMIGRTDQDGTVNAAGEFGPYMQKIPANPFTGGNTIDGTADWSYTIDAQNDPHFVAADGLSSPDGTAHADL